MCPVFITQPIRYLASILGYLKYFYCQTTGRLLLSIRTSARDIFCLFYSLE
uniref:Uncharacterized protein n=1 Tax=Arundo donax TaxID=35708 RepID=A0A0A9AXA8_ARUDO